MLQRSGLANTPCSGWRFRNHVQSQAAGDLKSQTGTIRSSSAAAICISTPCSERRARNRIFAARDKATKSAFFLARDRSPHVAPRRAPANAAFSRKVSENPKIQECVVGPAGLEPATRPL